MAKGKEEQGLFEPVSPGDEEGGEFPEVVEGEWRDVFADQYKFQKEGDSLRGVLVARETSSFGVGAYLIQVDEEHSLSILGTTVLDRLLVQIPIGHEIQVTFMGTQDTAVGRKVKQFAVRHRVVPGSSGE